MQPENTNIKRDKKIVRCVITHSLYLFSSREEILKYLKNQGINTALPFKETVNHNPITGLIEHEYTQILEPIENPAPFSPFTEKTFSMEALKYAKSFPSVLTEEKWPNTITEKIEESLRNREKAAFHALNYGNILTPTQVLNSPPIKTEPKPELEPRPEKDLTKLEFYTTPD